MELDLYAVRTCGTSNTQCLIPNTQLVTDEPASSTGIAICRIIRIFILLTLALASFAAKAESKGNGVTRPAPVVQGRVVVLETFMRPPAFSRGRPSSPRRAAFGPTRSSSPSRRVIPGHWSTRFRSRRTRTQTVLPLSSPIAKRSICPSS